VKSVLDEFNGRIDHETISQMPYLEAAINENLRMCPPVIR
jgi:cytochrome P450